MSVFVLLPVGAEPVQPEHLPAVTANNDAPFSGKISEFTSALSDTLLRSGDTKRYPELVALGFWLRKSNINKMQQQVAGSWRKPLGLVVHYTPANVDTMFVYSWVCSLLMGNRNIV